MDRRDFMMSSAALVGLPGFLLSADASPDIVGSKLISDEDVVQTRKESIAITDEAKSIVIYRYVE